MAIKLIGCCPMCASDFELKFTVLCKGVDEKGDPIIALLSVGKCEICSKMRGDHRTIRLFYEVDPEDAVQAYYSGLECFVLGEKDDKDDSG